mgnify:CR=1 FL=1
MVWNCQFHRQGLPVSSLRTVSFITENCQFHLKKLCGTGVTLLIYAHIVQ